jgi:L-rhamnose isomerase
LEKALIGLDFFDASINRIAAWVIGTRNVQKALLFALLQPNERLRTLQDNGNFTEQLMLMEETKTLPFGDIWEEYCHRQNVCANDEEWFAEIKKYEQGILSKRV